MMVLENPESAQPEWVFPDRRTMMAFIAQDPNLRDFDERDELWWYEVEEITPEALELEEDR